MPDTITEATRAIVVERTLPYPPAKVWRARGGSASNAGYGSPLDSVVTWTLTPVDGGTHVRMEQAGFRLPANQAAFDAMSPGWGRALDRIEQVLRQATE